MQSPVSLAFSFPLMYRSKKFAAYVGVIVSIDASATTAERQSAKRVHTASRRALVIRGLPFEESRSGRSRPCVYLYRIAGTI